MFVRGWHRPVALVVGTARDPSMNEDVFTMLRSVSLRHRFVLICAMWNAVCTSRRFRDMGLSCFWACGRLESDNSQRAQSSDAPRRGFMAGAIGGRRTGRVAAGKVEDRCFAIRTLWHDSIVLASYRASLRAGRRSVDGGKLLLMRFHETVGVAVHIRRL